MIDFHGSLIYISLKFYIENVRHDAMLRLPPGVLTAAQGLACLLSPPLAGLAVDMSGDPLVAFYLCAAALATSAATYTVAILVRGRKSQIAVYDRIFNEI